MYLFFDLMLIVCGVLAAASLIVQKQPNAKELVDKLIPYQGAIGVAACIIGLWNVIVLLLHISAIRIVFGWYLAGLCVALTMTALGFVLGYGLINQYVLSRNPQAAAQGALVQRRLLAIQVPLGLVGIALGVWGLVMTLVSHV